MAGTHPYLGLVACLIYIAVAVACTRAAMASRTSQRRIVWFAYAAFFMALAAVRITGAEALVANGLRHWLYEAGTYQDRREIQRPLAAGAVVALSGILFLLWFNRPAPRAGVQRWAIFWGMLGIAAMCGLVAIRLISFHELDRLLYGSLRMNWLLDTGSSAVVTWAALRYCKAAGPDPQAVRPSKVNLRDRRER